MLEDVVNPLYNTIARRNPLISKADSYSRIASLWVRDRKLPFSTTAVRVRFRHPLGG
jgi:hypothetical protein